MEVFYNMIFLVKDTGIPEEKELRVLAIGVEPTAFWLVLRMFYQLLAG